MSTPLWYFLLGSTPELSLAELVALTCSQPDHVLNAQIVAFRADRFTHLFNRQAPTTSDSPAGNESAPSPQYQPQQRPEQIVLSQLGGTIKILTHLETMAADVEEAALVERIVHHLVHLSSSHSAARLVFGVAELGRDHRTKLSHGEIKGRILNSWESQGIPVRPVRFLTGSRHTTTTAILLKYAEALEIVVVNTPEHTTELLLTTAVQDIDEWTRRDREKPYANRKKGMLPPKVARMMVNIALGTTANPDEAFVGDPYCGTGTVLIEALGCGARAAGADHDTEATAGTRENLEWFAADRARWTVETADATHWIPSKPITHLITEPYLGKPKPTPAQAKHIFAGLSKLYWGSFRHWRTILKPGAQVVVVVPAITSFKQRHDLTSIIDKLPSLGYTTSSSPVVYRRPNAIIERHIYHFTYTGEPIAQ